MSELELMPQQMYADETYIRAMLDGLAAPEDQLPDESPAYEDSALALTAGEAFASECITQVPAEVEPATLENYLAENDPCIFMAEEVANGLAGRFIAHTYGYLENFSTTFVLDVNDEKNSAEIQRTVERLFLDKLLEWGADVRYPSAEATLPEMPARILALGDTALYAWSIAQDIPPACRSKKNSNASIQPVVVHHYSTTPPEQFTGLPAAQA